MRFVFIINPAAGKAYSENGLLEELKNRSDFEYEIYYTKGPHDATGYVKQLCRDNLSTQFCFVACGGDGTINEVVNGMFGFENACLTVYPCGSGNDYVKYFGGKEKFLNLDNLIQGTEIKVDAMSVNGLYSINVASLGFDCRVLRIMEKVKRKPLIGGKNAYTTGIIGSLFTGLKNKCKVKADGEWINPTGEYLLCTIANGQYVGGAYKCAPRSVINDGLLEVCLVKPVPLTKLLGLIGKYQKGLHLDDEECKDYVVYRQAKSVELIYEQSFDVNIDGEIITNNCFKIENHAESVKFFIPKS